MRAPKPEWYRDAVIYQLHVRSFQDSDDNGIGDFDGLTSRLDYLQDLGVTALWLLPFYPSPLRDDGYDIADYRSIHPDYGSMASFRRFLREAHRRDLHVITELVLNHTSDQHPWFRRARRARPGSAERDFYVWSDTTDRYAEARIIFRDFETSNWTWDTEAGQYFWHRFYSHQPDLNYENPAVRKAVLEIFDFWLDQGVDGFRLDAVPYLYEADGTNCENLPPTHGFLRDVRRHVDANAPHRMLLAEANQWPEDAVAYFGDGDEAHMAFHFPIMPRLFMATRMEDRFPLVEILEQTPAIPDGCQWAMFLRNHDELTLEMVTNEERDYMYRVYASDPMMRVNVGIRRRLAPLLQNDRRRIELLNGLLFTLPGTPIVYYGDEIGMGDNVYLGDRNGVRTPMQWNADRNAGFSRANPQSLYLPVIIDPEYHYENINVETQLAQPTSLLRWMRQMITLRRSHPVFGRGSLRMLHPENPHVLAFVRELDDDRVLVVANLSRYTQSAEVDLSPWVGMTPLELRGGRPFPPIGTLPYLFTMAPYAFYVFGLTHQPTEAPVVSARPEADMPTLTLRAGEGLLDRRPRGELTRLLPGYLARKRWFAGKSQGIESISIVDAIPLPGASRREPAFGVVAEVELRDGTTSTYLLPLAVARGEWAERLVNEMAHGVVAHLDDGHGPAAVYEALWSDSVASGMLGLFRRRRTIRGERGVLELVPGPARRALMQEDGDEAPRVLRTDQSNTSVAYGQKMMMKIFRRLDPGPNPELEFGLYLDDDALQVAPFGGALQYRPRRGEPSTIAVLVGFVPHESDAWRRTVDAFRIGAEEFALDAPPPSAPTLPELRRGDVAPPPLVADALGGLLGEAELLGQRTAELHAVLGRPTDDPAFAPEPYTTLERRALYQSMRTRARRTLLALGRHKDRLSGVAAHDAEAVLAAESELQDCFHRLLEVPVRSRRIRTHGDFHLGQVLFTGRDFVIVDFEGEPARSIGERRLKHSALRDVASMIRSFDYAARGALAETVQDGADDEATRQDRWAAAFAGWSAAAFMRGYRSVPLPDGVRPEDPDEEALLFDLFLLDKAIYEIGYELDSRPDFVRLPLAGLRRLLEGRE